jgi:hypothetical protein
LSTPLLPVLVANPENPRGTRTSVSSGRATSPELSAYLAHLVREEVARGASLRGLAQRAGVTHATLSLLMSSNRGAGWKTMQGLARALGKSIGEIESGAEQFASEHPVKAAGSQTESVDRYPNRALAAEFARRSGMDDAAIAQVQSMELLAKDDPTPREWLRWIESAQDQLRYGLPSGQPIPAAMEEALKPKMPKGPPKK